MKRPTEAQAAAIERRVESLRLQASDMENRGQFTIAARMRNDAAQMERAYWDACGLSRDVRAQFEALRQGRGA